MPFADVRHFPSITLYFLNLMTKIFFHFIFQPLPCPVEFYFHGVGIHLHDLPDFFQGLFPFIKKSQHLAVVGSQHPDGFIQHIVAGFLFWPRRERRRLAFPLVAGSVALWLVISSYTYWQGGPAFGPRHLVPIIPLLGCGLAFWPSDATWNRALAVIAAVSITVNLVGTATTPFVSEFIPDPLVSVYPRLVADGATSINPVEFLTPSPEVDARWENPRRYPAASYNIGERLGFRGWWSLLPLVLVWVAGLSWRRRPSASPRVTHDTGDPTVPGQIGSVVAGVHAGPPARPS